MTGGSVVVHRRRCGKRNCRCAAGDLPEATALSTLCVAGPNS